MASRPLRLLLVGLLAGSVLLAVAPAARADCCMCEFEGVPCPESGPVCFTNQTSCATACPCSNGGSQNGGFNFACGEGPFAPCQVIDGTPIASATATATATAAATATATATPTLVPNGGSCTADGQCASGACRGGVCIQGAAVPAVSPRNTLVMALALLLAGIWSARVLRRR